MAESEEKQASGGAAAAATGQAGADMEANRLQQEFADTGRVGRRNAMAEALDPAYVSSTLNTAQLAAQLEGSLTMTPGSSKSSEASGGGGK